MQLVADQFVLTNRLAVMLGLLKIYRLLFFVLQLYHDL